MGRKQARRTNDLREPTIQRRCIGCLAVCVFMFEELMMRKPLSFIALVAVALAPAAPALAHAHVVASTPAANAAIAAPKQVSVTFSEKLVPAFSKLEISMAGMDMNVPVKTAVSKDGKTMTGTPQGAFMKGSYVINWSAASVDGHKSKGSIPFKIK
jgi:methionine-rich copper-binding protein CopC